MTPTLKLRNPADASNGSQVLAVPPLSRTADAKLRRWRQMVDQMLERLLPRPNAIPQVVHEGMRYCVFSGGKRFRPALCLGATEAVGGSPRQALHVACALELIHTYSLVHDDLPAMDNADERRGQPTCHRKFGEGNAILIGDALLTLAFETLSGNGASQPAAILRTIGRACGTSGLIGGQVLDLQAISQPRGSTEQTLTDIARRKTGALITASVVAGGLAGGANAEPLKRLTKYGQDIGLAFQLIDDIHDRDGLAQMIGLDEARRQAHHLAARATQALEPLGKRAAGLRDVAAWLATTA